AAMSAARNKGLGAVADNEGLRERDRLIGEKRAHLGGGLEVSRERLDEPLPVPPFHHDKAAIGLGELLSCNCRNKRKARKTLDGHAPSERERPRGSNADPNAREAAGAAADGDRRSASAVVQFGYQRHQPLRVPAPYQFVPEIEERRIIEQRSRTGLARRVDDQSQHPPRLPPIRRCG